jgi:tRNA pseudouridine38-40 synthase
MLQLVLHYDGTGFSGWQRQPDRRTVQGVVEEALARLFDAPTAALGSGRTDAGVHARGQAVGVRAPGRWSAPALHRAMNAVLPHDVWVAGCHPMREDFHARFSATARRYSYYVGTDAEAASPFRRHTEWAVLRSFDRGALDRGAALIEGDHCFRAFAVRGTAPASDDHRCRVREAIWRDRPGGLVFEIEANRFLHHMVRFLVGTMMEVATARRPLDDVATLLLAADNDAVSPPSPPHGLFLDRVQYPADLYLSEP